MAHLTHFSPPCLRYLAILVEHAGCKSLHLKCGNLYGIEPELLDYKTMRVLAGNSHLRPEIVESTYYLYHYTRDPEYRKMGEILFNGFVRYCRADTGYVALADITTKRRRTKSKASS